MRLFNQSLEEELNIFGVRKSVKTDTVLLPENSYIKSIPIVVKGSLKVLRQDEERKEILLYYIYPKIVIRN